jgi:nitrite reductase (NADH) small subunit
VSAPGTTFQLGPAAAIPRGEGRTYRVADREIAIFRSRTDRIHAIEARCPHRHGPLADGLMGDGRVMCPLHGYTFDLCSGRPVSGECRAIEVYPVTVDDRGHLVLELA